MIRSVLVPLDGSEFSEHVLPLAAWLARSGEVRLRLLHVHQPLGIPAPGLPSASPPPIDPVDAESHAHARQYLDDCAERLQRQAGVDAEVRVLLGALTTTLATEIARSGVDLVAMTTHGRGGLARTWLGSTADSLVRQSTAPVLLLRPSAGRLALEEPPAIRHILVPLDGSTLSEKILPHAVQLATLCGAALELFTVAAGGGSHRTLLPQPPQDVASPEAAAQSYLHDLRERLRSDDVTITVSVRSGVDPAAAILAAAQESGADAIAMATHGRGGIRRMLIGSVADRVMRGCNLPILLFRPA